MRREGTLALMGVVLRRDLLFAMRRRADVLTTLFFFVIVVSLFPLGVGPEPNLLRTMAPGVVWVAALLAPPSLRCHNAAASARSVRSSFCGDRRSPGDNPTVPVRGSGSSGSGID